MTGRKNSYMDARVFISKEVARYHEFGAGRYAIDRLRALCERMTFHSMCSLVLKQCLTHPDLKVILVHNPRIVHKFTLPYLSNSLTKTAKFLMLWNHYKVVRKVFAPDFMWRIMKDEIVLWNQTGGQTRYCFSITYETAKQYDSYGAEGELSLLFKVNGQAVYTLSFSIVPGRFIQLPATQVLFISRMQGLSANFELIRSTAKAFNGNRPSTMVLGVARAIAQSLGITCIAGVGTKEQIVYNRKAWLMDGSYFDYDKFWSEVGGVQVNETYFNIPLQPKHAPLCKVKSQHRSQARRKRQTENDLILRCQTAFEQTCLKHRLPVPPASP